MKNVLPLLLCGLFAVTTSGTTISNALTFTPNPADLNNLDHHFAYTWRIDNINLGGATITGASLTFTNIRNWDPNPNILFIHLLDTAKYSGVASFFDGATGAPVPPDQFADDFAAPRLASNPLVAAGTANTFLTNQSFTMTPTTYVFNFTAAELAILQSYIANGNNIAFGIDPDCHYFNDGVTFRIATTAVPDVGSTAALFGLAIGFLAIARRKFCV